MQPPDFSVAIPPATAIYTLSLHDALPISSGRRSRPSDRVRCSTRPPGGVSRSRGPHETPPGGRVEHRTRRSEEHTSELQSPDHLVCRLLLEKKKTQTIPETIPPTKSPHIK